MPQLPAQRRGGLSGNVLLPSSGPKEDAEEGRHRGAPAPSGESLSLLACARSLSFSLG